MNTARLIAWMLLPLVALVALGWLALWVVQSLLGVAVYLLVGAAVAGGSVYLYRRAKRAVGPGTRTRLRLEAASQTYRDRNR